MDTEQGSFSIKSYLKFVIAFLAIIFFVFGGYIAWRVYDLKRGMQSVDQIAKEFEKADKEAYRRALADTYGGKTPQETLQLYITAVEKGDYELASKYFILDKQEAELNSLKNSPKANTDNVIKLLKQTLVSQGSFSEDKSRYVISRPLLVDFLLYPNNVWKIIEI